MISIIVPIYNVEKYLPQCLDSLISQTYRDIEIILVDDGSPDKCPEICDAYAKKDARIKVVHQINGGVSSARNTGLKASRGEYIGFVDPDDWVAPEMYEKMMEALADHKADLAICGYQYCHADGSMIVSKRDDAPMLRYSTHDPSCRMEQAVSQETVAGSLLSGIPFRL